MDRIPFLRPAVPTLDRYAHYLESIDRSRIYSNFGPLVRQFESRLLQEWCGGGYGLTVSNATLGLMLAIRAMQRPGGRVAVLPSFTFAATAQAARWCGLELRYVDIDPESWTLDVQQLASTVAQLGDDLAIVITYATFGTALDLAPYHSLMSEGVPVVVDAAPGFGTTDAAGKPFGEHFPGAIVYSFHATKPFGIGEGGFILSADKELVERLRRLTNFGFTRPGEVAELGMNAKLSELAAAVGLATLDGFAEKKAELERIFRQYCEAVSSAGLLDQGCLLQGSEGYCVHQFLPLLLPRGKDKRGIMASLDAAGVEVRSYFDPPCHRQAGLEGEQGFDDKQAPKGISAEALPQTAEVAARILCLPLWQGMGQAEVQRVVETLAASIAKSSA